MDQTWEGCPGSVITRMARVPSRLQTWVQHNFLGLGTLILSKVNTSAPLLTWGNLMTKGRHLPIPYPGIGETPHTSPQDHPPGAVCQATRGQQSIAVYPAEAGLGTGTCRATRRHSAHHSLPKLACLAWQVALAQNPLWSLGYTGPAPEDC